MQIISYIYYSQTFYCNFVSNIKFPEQQYVQTVCDTEICKTLYILLSVLCQSNTKENDDKSCYLTAEKFNWKHNDYKDSLFSVLTVGTKCTIVKLPAG